ncbi:MAG: DNA-binding protein [Fluviicola sp.]|nr:MAG: DNA-binding protein [Fluviicola sp.]
MELANYKHIEKKIFTFRGIQVMLDSDLAELYQVETKVLNQAVKRNIDRFPESFRFQLNSEEKSELVTNCDRFDKLKHSSSNPYAFTEQGVAMLSAVLRSDVAVKASIQIMQAFVNMRKFLLNNDSLFQRLDQLETKQLKTEEKVEKVFKALEAGTVQPEKGIFFDGEIFDAYTLVSKIIKSASKSIILIDNYIDESVLTLLTKRSKKVSARIYTHKITKALRLDLEKHNEQYNPIQVYTLKNSHDRFLIIDEKHLYHIGASLKDLGKKWFAFSQMDDLVMSVLNRLK